jgi:uncharacterized protein (TIGR02453 family)
MAFQGWPAEALEFYEGLEADNSKSYWAAHKAVYEEKVLGPMAELLEDLSGELGTFKIFRPYRDIRFSRDKSPYKISIDAVIGGGFIRLSADGLAAGSGMHEMTPEQLASYRRAAASDVTGPELERIISGIERQQIEVVGRDPLKSAPRGYPADHPRIGLLRYKGLIAWKEWPAEPWLATSAARDRVAGFLNASLPLNAWLQANVGGAEGGPAER